jgi:predicted RNase H-like HicB family nuclease
MHKYSVNIYWSDEDQVFIAEVPELPGCVTHGDTHASALANANEAINLWIETAKEFGDSIPLPKGRSVISSTGLRSKTQSVRGQVHQKRRNNPRITLSVEGQQARMNPKAH